MSKRKSVPAVQIDDGEWVTYAWSDQREMCCDCGLVHRLDFRVVEDEYLPAKVVPVKGKIQIKARRID